MSCFSARRVSGFFCNGELGAPGLTKPSADLDARAEVRPMSLHGFTAVFAPGRQGSVKSVAEDSGAGQGLKGVVRWSLLP